MNRELLCVSAIRFACGSRGSRLMDSSFAVQVVDLSLRRFSASLRPLREFCFDASPANISLAAYDLRDIAYLISAFLLDYDIKPLHKVSSLDNTADWSVQHGDLVVRISTDQIRFFDLSSSETFILGVDTGAWLIWIHLIPYIFGLMDDFYVDDIV